MVSNLEFKGEIMNILLTCGGGISSTFIAKQMNEIANKSSHEVMTMSCGYERLEEYLSKNIIWDVVLVAPQVAHEIPKLNEISSLHGVDVIMIKSEEYSMSGIKKLYKRIVIDRNGKLRDLEK